MSTFYRWVSEDFLAGPPGFCDSERVEGPWFKSKEQAIKHAELNVYKKSSEYSYCRTPTNKYHIVTREEKSASQTSVSPKESEKSEKFEKSEESKKSISQMFVPPKEYEKSEKFEESKKSDSQMSIPPEESEKSEKSNSSKKIKEKNLKNVDVLDELISQINNMKFSCTSFQFTAVGMRFRGGHMFSDKDHITLQKDDENSHDKNAVKILVDNKHVAYATREDAVRLRRIDDFENKRVIFKQHFPASAKLELLMD